MCGNLRIGSAGTSDDTRTQYPAFMANSFFSFSVGSIGYLFSGTQLEQAEKMTRMFMKPAMFAVVGFLGGLFWGTLISLVTSAFLKRKATEDVPPLAA